MTNEETKTDSLIIKLSDLKEVNEGIRYFLDENKEQLVIVVRTNGTRKVSSTGKTVSIASCYSAQIRDSKKLTVNFYDKEFTDEDLDQLEKLVEEKESGKLSKNNEPSSKQKELQERLSKLK